MTKYTVTICVDVLAESDKEAIDIARKISIDGQFDNARIYEIEDNSVRFEPRELRFEAEYLKNQMQESC